MREDELQELLRSRLGLRVEREMAAYMLRQLESGSDSIPIIAGDARTGAAISRTVSVESLRSLFAGRSSISGN